MSTSSAERRLIVASATVAMLAIATRVHDVVAYPALHEFDASGHALNVVDLFEGRLPNPRSWSGGQPPLYYGLGAGLWALLPERVPVHVMLRSLSVASWLAAVGLVWRVLRRTWSEVDAAVVAALLLGVPGILIGSCMMTNDALCALFVTATLVRLLRDPREGPPTVRHAALTGLLAGLATLAKTPGLVAVAVAGAWYAWRSRRSVPGAVGTVAAFGLVAAGIAGPHYGRLVLTVPGSLFDVLMDMSGSQEKRATVALVLATVSPEKLRPWMPALLHVAVWGDPVSVFLPAQPGVLLAMLVLLVAGLGVLGVALVGVVRLVRRREPAGRLGAPLAFGALLAASLVRVGWIAPTFMVAKPTYMLPSVLPVAIVLASGLAAFGGVRGTMLRAAFLAIAVGGAALAWYGWWLPVSPVPPAIALGKAPPGSAVQAVERYFRFRADDPVRAVPLLAADLQLVHGLRVARILQLSVAPEPSPLSPADERALEVARARVAWMDLYHIVDWLQPVAAALAMSVIDAHEGSDDALVRVRVGASAAPPPWGAAWTGAWPFDPFEQDFTLRRAGDGWRITAIEQRGVSDENAGPAFVASPTLAGLQRLRSLGWRPSWERAPPRGPAADAPAGASPPRGPEIGP